VAQHMFDRGDGQRRAWPRPWSSPARPGPRARRRRRQATLHTLFAATIALTLAACSAPNGATSNPGSTRSVDGVWRSEGYGWILSVSNGRLQTYESTSMSCLPAQSRAALDPPGPQGGVQFGKHHLVDATIQRTDDRHALLHLTGDIDHIVLDALPALPPECDRPTPKDALTSFDIFWSTFAENYNSFPRKHIDWNAVRARYRPQINQDTDTGQLYQTLVAMIAPLGDAHTSIGCPGHHSFSGKRPDTRDENDVSRKAATKAVDAHLHDDLGVQRILSFANGKIAYADLPDGRGYLRLTAFENLSRDRNSPYPNGTAMTQALDAIFTAERVKSWRELVIDLRWNSGGDDPLGIQLAGRLTDAPYTAYTKQARTDPNDPTRYGPPITVTVTPAQDPRYSGPVRLLTSDLTVSAGETFVEAMMARTPAPSRVGMTTQGVFSDDMDRKLPNGCTFSLGNENYVASNGTSYEGVGIPPTIQTPVFTPAELDEHGDSALDAPWATDVRSAGPQTR